MPLSPCPPIAKRGNVTAWRTPQSSRASSLCPRPMGVGPTPPGGPAPPLERPILARPRFVPRPRRLSSSSVVFPAEAVEARSRRSWRVGKKSPPRGNPYPRRCWGCLLRFRRPVAEIPKNDITSFGEVRPTSARGLACSRRSLAPTCPPRPFPRGPGRRDGRPRRPPRGFRRCANPAACF